MGQNLTPARHAIPWFNTTPPSRVMFFTYIIKPGRKFSFPPPPNNKDLQPEAYIYPRSGEIQQGLQVLVVLLVSVVFRLIGAFHFHAKIFSLVCAEGGQFNTQLLQVKTGHLFIKVLGKHINANLVIILP